MTKIGLHCITEDNEKVSTQIARKFWNRFKFTITEANIAIRRYPGYSYSPGTGLGQGSSVRGGPEQNRTLDSRISRDIDYADKLLRSHLHWCI